MRMELFHPLHTVVTEEHAVDVLHALRHAGGAIRHGHACSVLSPGTDHAEDLSQLFARHLVLPPVICVLSRLSAVMYVRGAGVPEVSGTGGQVPSGRPSETRGPTGAA